MTEQQKWLVSNGWAPKGKLWATERIDKLFTEETAALMEAGCMIMDGVRIIRNQGLSEADLDTAISIAISQAKNAEAPK